MYFFERIKLIEMIKLIHILVVIYTDSIKVMQTNIQYQILKDICTVLC